MVKKNYMNCFYGSYCTIGYNHPKECKSCYSFVKLTKTNAHLPNITPYWKFNKKGDLIV